MLCLKFLRQVSMIRYPMPWVPPFLNGRVKTFLYTHGEARTFKKGEIVVNEDYLQRIIILKSGLLSNSITNMSLNKAFMMSGIRLPGHISGYTTYLVREPAPICIAALTASEIRSVTFEQMDRFLAEDPDLRGEFLAHCGRSLRANTDAILAIATMSAEERFWILHAALFMLLNVSMEREWLSLPFRINRETLSGLLYVSQLTIDRMHIAFQRRGLIRKERRANLLHRDAVEQGTRWIRLRYKTE